MHAPTTRDIIRAIAAPPMPKPADHIACTNIAKEVAMQWARRQTGVDPRASVKRTMWAPARAKQARAKVANPKPEPVELPDRWCANPGCGKLIVRKAHESAARWAERSCCSRQCAGRAQAALKAQRCISEDDALGIMARAPGYWWRSPEVADAAGVRRTTMTVRLLHWRDRLRWVTSTGVNNRMLWTITESGLSAAREAGKC